MHTLVLTCAGKSTRFPNHRPKWSLTHPDGHTMAAESIRLLSGFARIIVAHNAADFERFTYGRLMLEYRRSAWMRDRELKVVNVGDSPSHVETIRRALELESVQGPFTAKDCDNQFELDVRDEDSIAVVSLMEGGKIDPTNKSYVRLMHRDAEDPHPVKVMKVQERELLSEFFCCGAYTFADSERFWVEAAGHTRVSSYIDTRAGDFHARLATKYVDWGTEDEWAEYLSGYMTIFVDVDGVLVESSHRSFEPAWGETRCIGNNVQYLNRLHATGRVEIILTTSRSESWRKVTEQQLLGLKYDRLIMGLRNCGRYLVNDFVSKRGEATAFAINLERDSSLLEQALRRRR